MKKEKPFDAVAEARRIRRKMSVRYNQNPTLFFKEVAEASARFQLYQAHLREERLKREQDKLGGLNEVLFQ